jgi:hypothetical protein
MRTKQDIEFIAVHCSATLPRWGEEEGGQWKVDQITDWHIARGWLGNGYNELIDRDGRLYKGRDLDDDGELFEEIGAHIKGLNKISYGICLIGGHGASANDEFSDHFTPMQEATLRRRLREIRRDIGRDVPVRGHNEFANKACPGFNVQRWENNRPIRTSPLQSTTLQAAAGGVATVISGVGGLVLQLEGAAQTVAIAGSVLLTGLFLWIMRERLVAWSSGRR